MAIECDTLRHQLRFPVTIDVTAITLEAIQPDETSRVLGRFPFAPKT